jgi:HAD superfamily hydrolase (TIGR01490 family)
MSRRLALFDLDNTLLAGDSDHAWGEFLIAEGLVDADTHARQNDAFYADYKRGDLDIDAYVKFTLGAVLDMSSGEQKELRERYFAQYIEPMMSPASLALLKSHKDKGDFCLIITATNAFLTTPIAEAYGVDQLIATDLVERDGKITGEIAGIPCFQGGKVERLQAWLESDERALSDQLSLANSIFYSDSSNDLPLLEAASEAVVVDGDEKLLAIAQRRDWQAISLRD